MIHKFAVFTSMMLSVSCMVLHQPQSPLYGLQYNDNPSYNYAYEVNEAHTGDIKSQHESRRGNIVLGQYSLLQPDGIQRTVDYRADDHTGFKATVNNQGRYSNGRPSNVDVNNAAATRHSNPASNSVNLGAGQNYQAWPTPSADHSTQTAVVPAPVALSASSFVQAISHDPILSSHNGYNVWA